MWIAGIWSDQQIPYHDPRAFSVAVQIFADAKLDLLIDNGDWGDYMALATHPKGWRTDAIKSFREEILMQRELTETSQKAIKPKKRKRNDGNHEWRVQRAFERDPKLARTVLDIDFAKTEVSSVKEACSIPVLMELRKHGIQYSGMYPKGCWLKDGLEPEKNVYVHHGYTARKKAGYTVTGQMDDHWSSQIVGHCERLAGPIWNRRLGRDFFGIESGNLSLIGEPDLGDDIYAGVPHSDAKLMNHRQGISIIYYDQGQWSPYTIKIRDGRAVWNGKAYKS
jgi:hypothetical protein